MESILSREVVTGKMNLYAAYFDFKNGNNSGYMYSGSIITNGICYYLIRDNEKKTTKLVPDIGGIHKCNRKAARYLSDCPELARKLKKRIYGQHDIPSIVMMYNNGCKKIDVKK